MLWGFSSLGFGLQMKKEKRRERRGEEVRTRERLAGARDKARERGGSHGGGWCGGWLDGGPLPSRPFREEEEDDRDESVSTEGVRPGGLGCSKVAGSGLTRARKGRGNLGQGEEEQPREKRGFAVFFFF